MFLSIKKIILLNLLRNFIHKISNFKKQILKFINMCMFRSLYKLVHLANL